MGFFFWFFFGFLPKLIGSATRLCELYDVLDELDRAKAIAAAKLPKIQEIDTEIAMANVDLVTPNGECTAPRLDSCALRFVCL